MKWTKKNNLSAPTETFQNHTMHINTDDKSIDTVRITTLRNITNLPSLFDTIRNKSSKIFGIVSEWCLEKVVKENQNRGSRWT